MWWIKLFGSVCILMGCGSVCVEKTSSLKRRIRMLREMERSLNMFQDMTHTYRLPLEMVFQKISQQMEGEVSVFFQRLCDGFGQQKEAKCEDIWRETMKNMGKAFDKEDQVLFLPMETFIGGQNLDLQSQVVNSCREQIRQRIYELESRRPEQEKLYCVLTFTLSGFLILLFI